ncbi:MAG: DUF1134 domain-containing protein [Alphaproteobacteria bacterium]
MTDHTGSRESKKPRARVLLLALLLSLATGSWTGVLANDGANDGANDATAAEESGFTKNEIIESANSFFGATTAGLADVVEKAFQDHGRPNAYITGEEVSGAVGVGVKYGRGDLNFKSGGTRKVFWQGPTVGFDFGGNASKIFVLVYNLETADALFQRFPGGEGSIYVVGGVGMHYLQSDGVILAPIKTGVGLRAGVNVGYMHFTREASWNPF